MGLIQAHAYRILKKNTTKALAQFKVSTVDWAMLGVLSEHPNGMRVSDIAKTLGVSVPFATTLVVVLEKKELVSSAVGASDNRVKIVSLTKKGFGFVEKVEQILRREMRPLVEGVSPRDLLGYLIVLEKIIENSSKK